ncbi:unnamed protein product [Withania somnifera]
MDIISQLQEQVNTIAALSFNTFGTLQRNAPPVRLSPNYPEPPPTNLTEDSSTVAEQPKQMSATFTQTASNAEKCFLNRLAGDKLLPPKAENDEVGQELLKQLEAAGKELKQVQELFNQATDNCLNLKKPE